jgi:hypothetical protein
MSRVPFSGPFEECVDCIRNGGAMLPRDVEDKGYVIVVVEAKDLATRLDKQCLPAWHR